MQLFSNATKNRQITVYQNNKNQRKLTYFSHNVVEKAERISKAIEIKNLKKVS